MRTVTRTQRLQMLDCSCDEPLAFCIEYSGLSWLMHQDAVVIFKLFYLQQVVVICFEKPTMLTKNNSPGSCVLNPAGSNHAISQFHGRSTNHTGPREKLRISALVALKRLMKIDNLN